MERDKSNCYLGDNCQCETEWWKCMNWCRSRLAMPNIVSAYSPHRGDALTQHRNRVQKRAAERIRVNEHNKKVDAHLKEVRHSDPIKHLSKKGANLDGKRT